MLVPSNILFKCNNCGKEDGIEVDERTTAPNENNVQYARRVLILVVGWQMTEESDLCPDCIDN